MDSKKNTIDALIELGQANGKLTTKEITDALEELDFDVDQINTFYDRCEALNIEIVEDMNIDADLKIGLDSTITDDLEMALTWALFPLHRDLVRTYFTVVGELDNGKPERVMNRFRYILDPDEKHLLSAKFAQYGRFNVMSFGRISHRRFSGVSMSRYSGSFAKADPFANIKKKYPNDFNGDPSWMFDR